jgi:Ca2+-binding RTX toxin-like protein
MTQKPERLEQAALTAVAGGAFRGQLVGTEGADSLAGGPETNLAWGAAGNDTVVGNGGNDRLSGGTGDDLISGGEGTDLLAGDAGQDTVDGGAGSDIVTWRQGDGNDSLVGGSQHELGDVLRMEVQGMSGAELLQAIQPDPGSSQPRLLAGGNSIDLTGVTGTITIGGETIRFAEFERLMLVKVGGR